MRFVIRVVVALLVATDFDAISAIRAFVLGAIIYALTLSAHALHAEYYRIGPLRHMETHNIPAAPYIPAEPPTHIVVLVATQALVLLPGPLGAHWYVVLALSLFAATATVIRVLPDARITWQMRQQKRATGLTGPLQNMQDFIDDYQPEIVVHLSGPEDAGYQINTWLEALESLDNRVLIVLRDHKLFTKMKATSLPVLELTSGPEFMMLNLDCVRIALYPSNTGNNIHLLRLPSMMSAFIGHGDSDKSASNNPFSRVYDELWVAGEAGADRYRRSELGIHESQFRRVGRPQVGAVAPSTPGASLPTLLYAPTWEGVNLEQEYSSLLAAGETIIRAALDCEQPIRVIYKPHPFTGQRDAKYRLSHAAIVAMLNQANAAVNADHLVVGSGVREPNLIDCFNLSTALISDISSVISDYLASEKPYAVFNHSGSQASEFVQTYPSAGAATIIGRDGSGISEFLGIVSGSLSDAQSSERAKLAEYLLGAAADRSTAGFQRAVTALLARSEVERADYRAIR